jgi:hypothetical protein
MPNEIVDLEVMDDRLFVALGRGGVKILNIKKPAPDRRPQHHQHPFTVHDVAISKDMIFLAWDAMAG